MELPKTKKSEFGFNRSITITDMNKRVDKLNLDRMSDMADIQAKMGLVGKSASRHLETLRAQLFRECQTLFELATKPCSIVFDAFREDSYTDGGNT